MKESVWNDRPWNSRNTSEGVEDDYRYESVSELLDQLNEGNITLAGLRKYYRENFLDNKSE